MWRVPLFALVVAAAALAVIGGSRTRTANAGSPAPCDGYEETVCQGGVISTRCCPKGKRCNFRNPPHVSCGDGYCVEGHDVGRCPAPQAQTTPAKSEGECKATSGSWEPACVGGKVTSACIMPVPTNYTGPRPNPRFTTCRQDRCTTSRFVEACHPARGEIADKDCPGFTKVCLGGKVAERCLPFVFGKKTYQAARYVECGDGSCAVGEDKQACRR
jgi:hypothetical protein